jgi:hypothetical protein
MGTRPFGEAMACRDTTTITRSPLSEPQASHYGYGDRAEAAHVTLTHDGSRVLAAGSKRARAAHLRGTNVTLLSPWEHLCDMRADSLPGLCRGTAHKFGQFGEVNRPPTRL